jgi:hypothetical protein
VARNVLSRLKLLIWRLVSRSTQLRENLLHDYRLSRLIKQLEVINHIGKARGSDDSPAEHLIYAHPSLIVDIRLSFHAIFVNAFVP